ncbi:hypothetical protein MBANPS3_010393 [Mucor bainieri]
MDDFVMTDSPAISPSPRSQALPDSTSLDDFNRMVIVDSSFGSASSLFPTLNNQYSNITTNNTITTEQTSILNTWQEGSVLATSSVGPDFEQDLSLQSGAVTAEVQPTSMMNTPELSSVYTSSYSPSLNMLSNLDHGYTIGFHALLSLQDYQEEFLPLPYEAQQQDMVSPFSQFDLMHSPANSYSIMEEQSVLAGYDDGRLYTTTMAMSSSSRSANAHVKPRYDCPECDQTFGRSQELKRHQQSCHSDIKNFRCDCCDKAFARKDALKRHEKSKKSDRQKRRLQRQGQSFSANKKVSP